MIKLWTIIFTLCLSVASATIASGDLLGKTTKLFKKATKDDIYDKLTKSEIKYYLKSSDKCTVKHGDDAMKSGIKSYNKWQRAFNNGVKKADRPKKAFSNAGQAFSFLYKSDCKDGWLHFRYAMMLYWKKDYAKSLGVLVNGRDSIEKNYPKEFIAKYYKWMGDVARTVYAKESGKGKTIFSKRSFSVGNKYYQKSMEFGNDTDTSFLLNYANFLKKGNCVIASNKLINHAKKLGGLSRYAINKVIPKIKKLKPHVRFCEQ